MKTSRFVVIRLVNLGRQGDYRISMCQYCGATAAVREDTAVLGERVAASFHVHHEHAGARQHRQAA